MALSETQILKLKVEYETGKVSKTKICKKHKVSRPTLRKHAKLGEWVYQKNFQKVSDLVEQKTIERLVETETNKTTSITQQFLSDIDHYRQLTMLSASEIAKALTEAKTESSEGNRVKISKNEFDRIFAGAKICKICLEALNVGYTGARKALGMDKDDDIKKAKELRQSEIQDQIVDPLQDVTEEELDKELAKLDD